jgi:hypothetical protein
MPSLDDSWLALATTQVKFRVMLYQWSDGQSILVSRTIWGPRLDFCYCQTVAGLSMWDTLWQELVCHLQLLLTLASSYSQLQVPCDSYFTASDSIFLKPRGPGPRIYIPQEHGDPVILPGTGFPFCVPVKVDFFNPSNRTMALGSTQPLTEMSTRNLPGG